MDQRVAVAVRIRPVISGGSAMHQQEQFEPVAAHRTGDTGVQLQEHKLDEACRSSAFTFDYVFDSDSTQLEVYEDAVVDLVDGALQFGNNATVLAYGQTGSGKTHSMLGDVRPNPLDDQLLTPQSGIFLRVLSDLLNFRDRRAAKMHVVLGLSCVEIYNDKIRDLFGGAKPDDPPPQLKAVMVDEYVLLPNMITKEVTSLQSVFAELQLAIQRRQSRATTSNAQSSRSHCLFTIDILQRDAEAERPELECLATVAQNAMRDRRGSTSPVAMTSADIPKGFRGLAIPLSDGGPPVLASKIVIADLAGSEKVRNSGVVGEGFAEATAINSSLTALGNVVHALHGGKLPSYRDSNLTRLLKPSFSQASSRVLLLAQIAPTQLTYEESLSTLHFANKVKAMKTINEPGVETDRLPFEYLAAARTLLALNGDVAVWSAQTGCRPSLRMVGGSCRRPYPFLCVPGGREPKPKERLQAALDRGAGDKYIAMRVQAEQEQAEDDRRFEQSLVQLEKHRKQQAVQVYQDKVAHARDAVTEAKHSTIAARMDEVINKQSADREAIAAEEASAQLAIDEAEVAGMKRVVAATEAALKELEAQTAKLKKSSAIASSSSGAAAAGGGRAGPAETAEEQATRAEQDEYFAYAVAHHCNARRTLNAALEARDTQAAFLVAATNQARLLAWAARTKRLPVPSEQTQATTNGRPQPSV